MRKNNGNNGVEGLIPVSNDAKEVLASLQSYEVEVTIEGICEIIFHRYSVESVEEKSRAAKGSKAKKTDDVESYVYRNDQDIICLPANYLKQTVVNAAKYRQDPRSPRKSLMDLAKGAIFPVEPSLCPIVSSTTGRATKDWDFIHQCRAVVQRNAVPRRRPAFHTGWKSTVRLGVISAEYISPALLNDLIQYGGKVIGIADNRPSYGRYLVTNFKEL